MKIDLQNETIRIVIATAVVLILGAGIGYILRRTGLERRLSAPICILIIVPTWLILGLLHLVWWQKAAVLLFVYPGAVLCIGTSVGARIADRLARGKIDTAPKNGDDT